MSEEHTYQKALEAAKLLKAYCASVDDDCTECRFDDPAGGCRLFDAVPEFWELSEEET